MKNRIILTFINTLCFLSFGFSGGIFGPNSMEIISGKTNDYDMNHSLKYLASGQYYLTYTSSGDVVTNNLYFTVNGTIKHTGDIFTIINDQNPLYFFFNVLTTELCSSQQLTIKLYTSGDKLVSSFNYSLNIVDNSRNNLLVKSSGTYYVGMDEKLYQSYWNGSSWSNQSITPYGGWGTVKVEGWLAGDYANNIIYFKGKNAKLYKLALSGNKWILNEIGQDVKSDICIRNNEIYFLGTDNKIHKVYYTTTWNDELIIPVNGWSAGYPAGSIELALTTPHIFYRTSNNKIYNLYQNNGQWVNAELVSPMGCSGDLLYEENGAVLYFKGTDNNLHNLYWNVSQWSYDPMILSSGGFGKVNNHLTKFPGEKRVFFKGTDSRAYNIYKNSSNQWVVNWLYDSYTDVAGDLVAAEEKIFYVSKTNQVSNFYWTGASWYPAPLNSGAYSVKGCTVNYFKNIMISEDPVEQSETALFSAQINSSISEITVYPNPTENKTTIRITSDNTENSSIIINDISGRTIFREEIDANFKELEVDFSAYNSGVYFVNLMNGESVLKSTKLIKK